MTNEEAIKTIETAKSEAEWNNPIDYCVAFDIAIEALRYRKHSCENCAYSNGHRRVANFLIGEDIAMDDISCEEWEEKEE